MPVSVYNKTQVPPAAVSVDMAAMSGALEFSNSKLDCRFETTVRNYPSFSKLAWAATALLLPLRQVSHLKCSWTPMSPRGMARKTLEAVPRAVRTAPLGARPAWLLLQDEERERIHWALGPLPVVHLSRGVSAPSAHGRFIECPRLRLLVQASVVSARP